MLFDQNAPQSAFWTPPQQATGFNKTLLSLMGYKGNGTQNGWGKVSSWIPGFGAAANNSAIITAKQAGLNDVASTIGEDTDNRMQKLQAGLQIAKAGVGAVTGNTAMISSGVQGLMQSTSGLMQANQAIVPYQGTTAYQRFADGGKLAVRPIGRLPEKSAAQKNVDQVTRQAEDKADMFMVANGYRPASSLTGIQVDPAVPVTMPSVSVADETTPIDTPALLRTPRVKKPITPFMPEIDDVPGRMGDLYRGMDRASKVYQGAAYTNSWMKAQVAANNMGMGSYGNAVGRIEKPLLASGQQIDAINKNSMMPNSRADGIYSKDGVMVRDTLSPAEAGSVATHETTHSAQNALGREETKRIYDLAPNLTMPMISTAQNIRRELGASPVKFTGNKQSETYLKQPIEVHARIMELRRQMGTMPGQPTSQESYDALRKKGGSPALRDLQKVLSDEQIRKLMDPNQTVMNTSTPGGPNDQLYAASGGKLPGKNRYGSHDKSSEDAVIIDKATGQKLGEMRHGERIFDQDATRTMEEFADKGDHASLGRFVLAEMATHPDRRDGMAAIAFADGGKVKSLKTKPIGVASTADVNLDTLDDRIGFRSNDLVREINNLPVSGESAAVNSAIKNGYDFATNWFRNRPQLSEEDKSAARNLPYPIATPNANINDRPGKQVNGQYDTGTKQTIVTHAPNMPLDAIGSTTAHETTHAYQDIMPGWDDQAATILGTPFRKAPLSGSKSNTFFNSYVSDPHEVHARLMQMRQELGVSPSDAIDNTHIERLKKSDKPYTKHLREIYEDKDILNLLNKTASTMSDPSDGLFRAANGGKLPGKPVGRLPEKNKAQQYADQSAFNRRIDEQMFNATNGYAPLSSYTGIQVGSPGAVTAPVTPAAVVPVDRPIPILPDPTGNNIDEVTVSAKRNATPQRALSMLPENPAAAGSLAAMAGRVTAPPIFNPPAATPTSPNPTASPATKTKSDATTTDWLGMGTDVVRGLTAAIGAAQPLPTRPINPNLVRAERDIADRANEGLSAGERTNLLRQQADAQARDVQTIRDTVGGGGSASAILSALGGTGSRAAQIGQQIEGIDRSQRAQNQQNYLNDLRTSQASSDNIYAQQYSQAVQNKAAYGQALAANIQNIADRQQYDKSYGKGSPYYNLLLQMSKQTADRQAFADAPVTSLPGKS